ncbi:MAG: signal recognition particle-docking protein FtsY [Gemmatimonadetes bacterium]|nr:signal recognition particle-docking protein FtsY [Gemmatimonadota bacterium]
MAGVGARRRQRPGAGFRPRRPGGAGQRPGRVPDGRVRHGPAAARALRLRIVPGGRHDHRRVRRGGLFGRHAAPSDRSGGPHGGGGAGHGRTGGSADPAPQNLVLALSDRARSSVRGVDIAPPGGAPVVGIFRRRPKEKGAPSLWRRTLGRAFPWKGRKIDDEALEELEEILIESDFGVQASMSLVETLQGVARRQGLTEMAQLKDALGDAVRDLLVIPEADLVMAATKPTVYLMVGVNGVGKTTTIGKMARGLIDAGMSVLVAAGDTYRAGAREQLERWAQRVGAEFVGGQPGADPAAVAFDALDAALARGTDIVLVDTAGRLHTHKGLMDELVKVKRVIAKKIEGAPHEVLLVLDATVGQNGIVQAREFKAAVDVSGIVLAKMDSTARGGVVVALSGELGLPVRLVGTGEGPGDLGPFDPDEFLAGVLDSA